MVQTRCYGGRPFARLVYIVGVPLFIFLIVQGFGGCDSCIPHKGKVVVGGGEKTSASVNLEVTNLGGLATSSSPRRVSVRFIGTMLSGTGSAGETTFEVTQSAEVSSNNTSFSTSRVNLRPGTWEVKVSVGNWASTQQGPISLNEGNKFTFVYP